MVDLYIYEADIVRDIFLWLLTSDPELWYWIADSIGLPVRFNTEMNLRILSLAGRRVVTYAYCVILMDFVMITSSSTSSLHHSVNAADVKPISQSLELQCPPCEKLHCSPRNVRRLRCKGGITRGVCNCCPVCAKLRGEPCGGQWNYLGKCDRGLKCVPNANLKMDFKATMTAEQRKTWIPNGRCAKGRY